MITSRYITFKDRIFERSDLMRLAKILDQHVCDAPGRRVWTKYEVAFEDGHYIEGNATEVFAQEELIRPSLPFKIEMSLYSSSESYVKVHLRCGEPQYKSENSISISGDDAKWVNESYTTFEDALGKVPPQDFWWNSHQSLLLIILTTGLFFALGLPILTLYAIIDHVWPIVFSSLIGSLSEGAKHVLAIPILPFFCFVVGWLACVPAASSIRRKLLSMWPSVEFNFGSRHLRPDRRRQKFNWTLTALIIPIFLGTLFLVLAMVLH